ncbi:hypothetical protein QYE76_011043 [Lolium multiflorum]|uniref:Retrotransposon gag domain-containing protein n=1 Tax=Lolium multiflorum TaxID=4521 RepID=A0AAD8TW74_LOLMU|nr:hypothetical protein QYE76_011043 [Lolium multiflorum]
MGKPRDTKIAILPSTTRKGTTLSTSAALDSPSVIDKLVSPPHASRAGTSAESENSHNIDNVSAVLDDSGSLGSFLDATIAKSRQIENTETPNAATPVNSPESVEYSSDDLDEDYVELDNDFIEKCKATTDARKIKKLLAEHAVRYTPSPDPKFATSPINIRDKDYDFSLDLSHIAIVEKTPFCGTEKESAVEHLTELSTLSGVFSDDVKMRTYFVAKIFPFSLKDDAKTWYNNLPPGSIKSPTDLRDIFFRKYFPASAQHAALQRIYNFDQEDGEKLPEAWARFCSLIRAQPDHDLEKHDLLDIFYSGLTIESRAYLDSCAGCVFRKRTPEDAEELLAKIGRNHDDWSTPEPTPTPIVKKRGMIKLNDEDMREAKKSLKEKGIKPEDVKNLPPIEDICETIPPSSMIEDPLYPEGHPKRIEQDSQPIKTSAPSKKKKKKHKNVVESSEPVNDPNSISISDAETESGNEHEEDNDKNDTPDKEEIEKEPEKPAKNKKYTKEDFITEKHGNEREPWVQKQMPFPAKKLKSKEEEHYNKFCDWMKPLFLQIPLTDAIKLPPYSKYMKDIVTNKRKVPNEEISTMLANYSFNGKIPKKLGDPGIPTIPCSIKNNYVRTALCDLGAGVSVMPFSLYKRLDLDKLIPTDISLQMADKSTAIPVGLCENVPVQVTQHCLILTDFVVLEMPEDDNMSIILGRPFLNTAGAVIDCNKGMVTFNVDDKEHTVYFPKRIDKDFKFNWSRSDPMVQYKIYNKAVNLPFGVFCAAIGVPQWGSCEKIRGTPRELSDLYTRICNGRSLSNDDAAGGTFMSITLGAATKLLDDMMVNYSEWHTERAPQGKKVNSVEETSSLSDKIDVIMSMLVNGRSNVDPNNVPLASLVAQEENVDVNFIKNNNFNNNAYRNNSGNNYRPYPSANGNGYGNSYGNSYNNNRSVPSGLEAMLKEFISTQTAFNKSVEEKLDKIDTIASRVDRLASDVNLLKLKVMPNNDLDNKITTTANAIQVRINENIRLMAELRARWDREENEKLAKENNVAKVWTITTTSNANSSHVAAPPTINGKIIGVGNVSTPSAKRTKLPEIAKTAETACDKTAEIFSNLGNNDPIAVAHNDLDFDDCHISEVIKFLQKLAKSPNASAINLAFTKHITNALIKAREEKLKLETSIPRKLEDGWEPIIKMKFNDFECNALCDLGASISVMPKKIYDMLDLPPLKNCYLDVNLADNVKKKPLGRIDNVHITVNNNLVPVDFVVLDIECNASCPIVLGRPFLRTVGAVIDMREGSFQGSREENDILRSRGVKALSLGMPPWFIPAYFKKTQASKLGDAQGIPFFIDNIIRFLP